MERKSNSSNPSPIKDGEVILGYCHRSVIPHTFLECVLKLQQAKIGVADMKHVQCFFVDTGRNIVVKEFLEHTPKAEWLLFVDDDIWFTPEDIIKLYKMADKDKAPIVGGLYFARLGNEGGHSNTILPVWLMKAEAPGVLESIKSLDGSGLQKVDVLGMGFTLIHRSVLETMRDKFTGGDDNWIWFGRDIRNGKRIGEDATFCLRAAELGYPIYGTPEVVLPHFKDHVYTAEMFMNQPGIFAPK